MERDAFLMSSVLTAAGILMASAGGMVMFYAQLMNRAASKGPRRKAYGKAALLFVVTMIMGVLTIASVVD